ncbi:MAG TPA: hypothetical protein VHQ95_07990 [Pyrinomonadaceae bacterium]|jgi:hypothetical protein|nr:hypothetical protein [Pyrinomonadaceae bacterium]
MINEKDDDPKGAADVQSDDEGASQRKNHKDQSNADGNDQDETKRFERSDNLRRRSEWFQKRTGGR